ncbi:MAG TPA: hypothetical protein VN903_28340 [Polyangia bacterium]|jgi:hypothetical protein|nr:hypothetical protein [Polyangia bacterium]
MNPTLSRATALLSAIGIFLALAAIAGAGAGKMETSNRPVPRIMRAMFGKRS